MGAIKWTGKAFQLVGKILTAEDFEKWIENEGKKILEEKLSNSAHKWFFGTTRAKRNLKEKALSFNNSSDAFKAALNNTLNSLPEIIADIGEVFKEKMPEILYEEETLDWICVLPRSIVLTVFEGAVMDDLSDSAELDNYPGLVSTLLKNRVKEAENAFFNKITKKNEFQCNSNYVLTGTDANYKWAASEIVGHYYLAFDFLDLPDITTKTGRNIFHNLFDPLKESLVIKIGAMNNKEHAIALRYFGYS